MKGPEREEEWASWMRAAMAGDARAYHRLLSAMTPRLRMVVRKRCELIGAPTSEVEDVVQEVLLSIHLKRGTWDPSRPLGPWLSAIARNKLIDSMRRRGRQISVPLDDVINTLESDSFEGSDRMDVERILASLKDPQRTIVQSISVEGASVRETAERLKMTEVAVRVSLHRALKTLAALYSGHAT
jgi:RNA polymerase sigma-70 factor (ECF subfamily)